MEPLLQPCARLKPHANRMGHKVEIARAGALDILRDVHTVELCIHAQLFQVLDDGIDHAVKGGAVGDEGCGHALTVFFKEAARSDLPPRVFQQFVGLPIEFARGAVFVGVVDRRHDGIGGQDGFGQQALIDQWLKDLDLTRAGSTLGPQINARPEAVDTAVEPAEQRLVRPFEIEHQPERVTHVGILPDTFVQIEDEALRGSDRSIGELGFDCIAVAQVREVIILGPDLRRVFGAERVGARLEALHRGGAVCEIDRRDLVKVILPDRQRVICAPIVRVAHIGHVAAIVEAAQLIGAGGHEWRVRAVVHACAGFFEPRFRQGHTAACKADPVAFRGVLGEGVLDLQRAGDFDACNDLGDDRAIFGDALLDKQVVAEGDVLGGHLGAVPEGHIVAQVEDDPRQIVRILHRGAQEAVGPIGVVGGRGQDAFIPDCRHRGCRTLAGELVEAVKRALRPDRNLATLRGVGVHVVQMFEIRTVFQLAKIGVTVADRGLGLGGQRCQRQQGPRGQSEPKCQGAGVGSGHGLGLCVAHGGTSVHQRNALIRVKSAAR